jgi:High-temperature-induced dauer-formation protein
MGASESKLVFKQGIFRLSEDQAIPAGDPYWTGVRGVLSLIKFIG